MSGVLKSSFPSAAEEELLDVLNFDEYLVPNKESTYILKVKGESMSAEGILPGDMLVVERRSQYKPGQVVVVLEDDSYTLAYMPASSSVPLKVEAVVTAVVRKY